MTLLASDASDEYQHNLQVFKSVANGTSLNNSLYLAIKDDSTSGSSSATIGTGSDTSVFGQIARTEDEAEESSRKRSREEELGQPEESTVKKQKIAEESPSSSSERLCLSTGILLLKLEILFYLSSFIGLKKPIPEKSNCRESDDSRGRDEED